MLAGNDVGDAELALVVGHAPEAKLRQRDFGVAERLVGGVGEHAAGEHGAVCLGPGQ